jgi:hypothetical protein
MTPGQAISDGFLAEHYAGPSWARWRAVLKAAGGDALTDEEHELFREVAERDPPPGAVRELWCVVGRRGGKDSIAAGIACVAAVGDYSATLRPGEKATILCLASNRDQAKIVLRYIKGYFATIPALTALVQRETEETLELVNSVEIVVSTNSFRAVRGKSIVCAIFDECAFYRSDESANPDSEVYAAALPAMATFERPMLVGISSPHRRSGLLYDKWREAFGKDDPDVLVVRGASTLFNPTLPAKLIERELERDPERARSEYFAEWRSDIDDFIDRLVVEACTARDRRELLYCGGSRYFAFCDPSGGSADSMTLAIAHHDARRGVTVLDAVREIKPPFQPSRVVFEFAQVLKSYRLATVHGDRYAGEWPRERFQDQGIKYELSDRPKSSIYQDSLPLLNSRTVELLDIPRLANQLCELERRTSRGGRDSIDHPPGGHDDLANAAMGALLLASGKGPQPARFINLNILGT